MGRPPMKTWAWMIAGAALLLSGCGGREPGEQAAAAPPAGERLVLAPTEIADMKAVPGEITTRDQAEALPRSPGTPVLPRTVERRGGNEGCSTVYYRWYTCHSQKTIKEKNK